MGSMKLWTVLVALTLTASAVAQNGSKPKAAKVDPIVLKAARDLRDHMRDPDSFRVNQVFTKGLTVCIEYRAKNGLGGYVNGHFAAESFDGKGYLVDPFKGDHDQDVWEFTWNAECTDKHDKPTDTTDKRDVTEMVKVALKTDRDKE
jgi:hypothetical protein